METRRSGTELKKVWERARVANLASMRTRRADSIARG